MFPTVFWAVLGFRSFQAWENAQPTASERATIANLGRPANRHSKVTITQKSPTQSVQNDSAHEPNSLAGGLAQRALSMRWLLACFQRRKSPVRFDNDPVKMLGRASNLSGAHQLDDAAFG